MVRQNVFCGANRALFSLLALLSLASPVVAQSPVVVHNELHHDVSKPLRDLAANPPAHEAGEHEADELKTIPLPLGFKPANEPDAALQKTSAALPKAAAPAQFAPTLGLNFEGLGSGFPNYVVNVAPPDTDGAVGKTQYVQWVNTNFAVFDKATGNVLPNFPVPGNTLWQGFGDGCETNNDGDIIVTYDKLADRWVFTQLAVGTQPFLQCVAVSTSSDATGTYNRYSFPYSFLNDYPKLAVWPDAYYTTYNMFEVLDGTFVASFLGAQACAFDRNAMLSGQAASQICFPPDPNVFGLLPADADGLNPPPAGSPNFMLSFDVNSLNLFKFHVDFQTPANSTLSPATNIPVTPFTPAECNNPSRAISCVPQPPPGDTTPLDTLGDRLMYRLAYRNFGDHESLVVNHSVIADPVNLNSGVRWYEIQNPGGTPTVAQQSTFAPDASFRWMGSAAMDVSGDLAVGYSVSSASVFPSIAFAARASNDPASTLQAETTLFSGTGSQTGFDSSGNPLTRWGDYSAMQVDPVDDCTFWHTTEYLAKSGSFNWNTRIATFKFANCGAPLLNLALSHAGNFTENQAGAAYTIMVTNTGAQPTDGTTVTVTDTLPAGLTATAASGTGWTCPAATGSTVSCNRTDVLASGTSYPPITVTVNVSAGAGELVTNTANLTGGGDRDFVHNTASDPTTITQTGPDLVIAKTHSGPFIQGQTGTYTVTVSNIGLSPTDGTTVTVTDALPAGLSLSAATGTGWTCVQGPPVSCTRSDVLASATSYPAITLTVNVDPTAPVLVVNSASVSGGGDSNSETASDPTKVIPPPPVLTITKSHSGNFKQGQSGVLQYTLTVTNAGGRPTSGLVTVTDTLPTGLRVTTGNPFPQPNPNGWSCTVNSTVNVSCTRSDVLAVGSNYPPITLVVDVDANAPASVINTATVSGGGALSSNTASDTTTINPAPTLAVTITHTGDPFVVGQTGTYTITVSNVGHAPTSGSIFVNDSMSLNSMTATSISGSGWVCSAPPTPSVSCNRTDALAAGSSYPPITLTVSVTGGGPSTSNSANVTGGGAFNIGKAADLTHITAPVLGISITHTGDFTVGVAGGPTYTITVSNTGPIAADGTVTVQESLPSGMVATSASGAGWSCSSLPAQLLTCTRSDSLGVGLSYPALNVTVRIDSALPTVVNTAQVTGGGDSTTRSASDTATVNAPSLGMTMTHSGNFVVGQTGIYTITVSNTGKIATVGTVTVNDSLPSGLTVAALGGPGWNCSTLSGVTCTRPDPLAPGASYPALNLTVNVPGDIGTSVTNSAIVFGGGAGGFVNASDTASINGSTLSITKSHSGTLTFGQTGTYTINVSNAGALATSGTVTVQELAPLASIVNSISGTGWSCSLTSVACTRSDSLSPGSSYPPITVTMSIATIGNVINAASVTGGGDPALHTASDTAIVDGVLPALSVTETHRGDFTVGQTGTYTITVANTGKGAIVGAPGNPAVVVGDPLPSGFAFNSFSGTGWSCSEDSGTVECTRSDSLAAGGQYPPLLLTMNVNEVNVNGGGPAVTNQAIVVGRGDPNLHIAQDLTNVLAPVLAITESHSPDPFVVGSPGTYTITVDNKAGKAATTGTVTVNDTLPTGLTEASISAPGWTCSTTTVSVSCNRSDPLAVGASYPAITVTVNVNGGSPSLITTPNVSGGGNALSHSFSDTTNITGPVLAITKSHTPDPLIVGQQGTYTFVVSNNGNSATSGTVTVSDKLPTGLTMVSSSGAGWACTGVGTASVNCSNTNSLAAGASYAPLVLTVNIGNSVPAFINTASVTGGGDVQKHSATDFANVSAIPQLAITKTHSGDFTVGQPGAYTIIVSNAGDVATTGTVTVKDNLPSQLSATSASGTNWSCVGVSLVTCTRSDSLASGQSYDPITLTVSINSSSFSTNSVINKATVTGGGDGLTHSASDPTTINTPALAISESHVGTFTAGQPASYTIAVSNPGTIATTGSVTVGDNLPSGFTGGTASGSGWTCSNSGSAINCSRQDALAGGGNYPAITVSGTIDPSAQSPLLNQATVSGGGDPISHTAADSASINFPDLAVTLAHTGNFFVGQTGATYTINISNVGSIPTAGGTITVVDPLPIGLTATQASGAGWTCQIFAGAQTEVDCTSPAGVLNPGSSYPPISVSVNVALSAPATLTNSVSFFGIGDSVLANETASDPTTIAQIAISSTSNPSVTVTAGSSATYSFQVNLGTNPPVGVTNFIVTGLPSSSNAVFTPSSLSQTGTVTMIVDTSGNGHFASNRPGGWTWTPIFAALLVPVFGLVVLGIRSKQTKKWLRLGIPICCLLLATGTTGQTPTTPTPTPTPTLTPSPSPNPTPISITTPPGTYTLTVTATSTSGQTSTTVTLVVQ
jgi:uncharacterized repeat protein (TIGR01451 family)